MVNAIICLCLALLFGDKQDKSGRIAVPAESAAVMVLKASPIKSTATKDTFAKTLLRTIERDVGLLKSASDDYAVSARVYSSATVEDTGNDPACKNWSRLIVEFQIFLPDDAKREALTKSGDKYLRFSVDRKPYQSEQRARQVPGSIPEPASFYPVRFVPKRDRFGPERGEAEADNPVESGVIRMANTIEIADMEKIVRGKDVRARIGEGESVVEFELTSRDLNAIKEFCARLRKGK